MKLSINPTKNTPAINICPGKVHINGRSIPEDAFEFFDPVIRKIHEYLAEHTGETSIFIHLDYVNSGSKKYLTTILSIFEKAYQEGKKITVEWLYDPEDEAMHDLGKDLSAIIHVPFDIKAIQS